VIAPPRRLTSRSAITSRRFALGLVLLFGLFGAGCSPLYVLRAGWMEAKVLWRREPIAAVLAEPGLDATTRRKLEMVLAARAFGDRLGLAVGESFTTLSHLDDDASIFVLTAASQTALESYTWWFPIVGRLPYKGYFSREGAEAEAARLTGAGYDTWVRRAAAFSTLGWFADPLLRQQLRHDERFLVDLVLHESYHATFYLQGAQATPFNESVATFVGHRGTIAFYTERRDAEQQHAAEDAWEDERRFGRIIGALAERLRSLYAESSDPVATLAGRAIVWEDARQELEQTSFHGGSRARALGSEPNNAVLLHLLMYATDLDLLEEVYLETGSIRAALDLMEPAARTTPEDPFAAVRQALAARVGVTTAAADPR
jgi:predicted aminopeptidase